MGIPIRHGSFAFPIRVPVTAFIVLLCIGDIRRNEKIRKQKEFDDVF